MPVRSQAPGSEPFCLLTPDGSLWAPSPGISGPAQARASSRPGWPLPCPHGPRAHPLTSVMPPAPDPSGKQGEDKDGNLQMSRQSPEGQGTCPRSCGITDGADTRSHPVPPRPPTCCSVALARWRVPCPHAFSKPPALGPPHALCKMPHGQSPWPSGPGRGHAGAAAQLRPLLLGWSVQCLQDWGPFFSLALPSMLMICIEWWAYEIGSFLMGTWKGGGGGRGGVGDPVGGSPSSEAPP